MRYLCKLILYLVRSGWEHQGGKVGSGAAGRSRRVAELLARDYNVLRTPRYLTLVVIDRLGLCR